jgi:uncharacterized protein YlzI (FlbEa/FlbD family)
MAGTEIQLSDGSRLRVEGTSSEIEARILEASRGAVVEFVHVRERDAGREVSLNPRHVVTLRPVPDEL